MRHLKVLILFSTTCENWNKWSYLCCTVPRWRSNKSSASLLLAGLYCWISCSGQRGTSSKVLALCCWVVWKNMIYACINTSRIGCVCSCSSWLPFVTWNIFIFQHPFKIGKDFVYQGNTNNAVKLSLQKKSACALWFAFNHIYKTRIWKKALLSFPKQCIQMVTKFQMLKKLTIK